MRSKKRGKTSAVILGIIIIMVAVMIYMFVAPKLRDDSKNVSASELNLLLRTNLSVDYPESPTEVVTVYTRLIKALYGAKYTDDQFDVLVSQTRMLFDEELLDENPPVDYRESVKNEVTNYERTGKHISSYDIAKAGEVIFTELDDGTVFAKVNATYYLKDKNGKTKVEQQYVLRKDQQKHWKIVFWQQFDKK